MENRELIKAQVLVDRIQSGKFDYLDVENLIMTMRESSRILSYKAFYEIAHFVAHNGERDRGLVKDQLDLIYYSMLYLHEFNSPQKQFNINGIFPSFIKDYLLTKLKSLDQSFFKSQKIKKKEAQKYIEEIEENEVLKMSYFKNMTKPLSELIIEMVRFIEIKPLTEQDLFLKDFCQILEKEKIRINKPQFLAQSDKICMSILYLLSSARFKVGSDQQGQLSVTTMEDGPTSQHNLTVVGSIPLNNPETYISIVFPIFMTNLDCKIWCDPNMFAVDPQIIREYGVHISEEFTLDVERFMLINTKK